MTPNFSLEGRYAVVTGGSRGIGRAIAEALGLAGASVAICARTQESVAAAVAEMSPRIRGQVIGKAVDLRSSNEVAEFIRFVEGKFGGIDILVNNAGVGIFRSVRDLTVEEWRTTIETNLSGVFYCCHEVLPGMINRGGGSIINISSLAGKNPFAGGAAYNASKFGLNGFSEAMMLDHRNDNIRVTCVMPGSVDTGFSPRSERAPWKIGPEDVAQVVMDVLSMPERTLVSSVEMRPSRPGK
jgi:NAD(P)-dependent dehydrogenase (short-subunit alcohol dehydrogenase family)